ncbi:MAG: GAF domain-containing protein [Armatimonadetes bacterium]|nr:GAF domain-containing protein [Armatimonadota bacterium]
MAATISTLESVTKTTYGQIMKAVATARNEDHLLNDLAHVLLHHLEVDGVDILLAERDRGVLKATTVAPELLNRLRIGFGVGLAGTVLATGQRRIVSKGVYQHPVHVDYPGYDETGFESAILEPFWGPSGLLGVLILRRKTVWKPRKTELSRISDGAERLAMAVFAYRSGLAVGQAKIRQIGIVSTVAETLARAPYLEEILQLLVNMTAQQFNYRVCTVRLLDEQNNELVLRATQATVKAYQRKRAIKLGESIAGRVIVERKSIIVEDVQADPEYIGHDLAVEQGLRSMICVPLTIQDRAVGVLTCYTDRVRAFEEDEVKALETIAKQAAVSIEHAKLQVRHTLMQEMHHRVKNNLQQVVSLLRLQLRHKHYATIEEAINDSLTRILAIAAVHDLLSREDLDHVGVRSIAEALVQHQQQSFIPTNKKIKFEVRGDDVRLNMTQATQVALVMNELIQNAVEHGFTVSPDGDVHINVETDDTLVYIWVSNNGDSLPPGFDTAIASHLGLQIVANLARALGGTFKIEERLGWTVCEVKFTRQMSE